MAAWLVASRAKLRVVLMVEYSVVSKEETMVAWTVPQMVAE